MQGQILVSGATGTQGGAVARALLDGGHSVRAMTRNPAGTAARALAARGAEVVAADFDDSDSLRRAATGVEAVYAMGTPYEADATREAEQARRLVDAAVAAGTDYLVYSSVASALEDTGVPHFESKAQVERHLQDLPIAHTVLAPAMFMDNSLSADHRQRIAGGSYAFPLPAEIPVQQIAIDDLAAFTALAFSDPESFAGRRIELASTSASGAQVAGALSDAVGHDVDYQEIPLAAIEASGNDDLAAMLRFFRDRGYEVDIDALHSTYPQIPWHGLQDWVQKQWSGYPSEQHV